MLLEIPPKMSVSGFMGYLKGKSSLMIYEKFGDLKFKYRNREFWCRGYYADTVGKNARRIEEYIRHQLEEDKLGEQLTLPYLGTRLRVASNRYANVRPRKHLLDAASKRALQAHKKTHRLGRWVSFCFYGDEKKLVHLPLPSISISVFSRRCCFQQIDCSFPLHLLRDVERRAAVVFPA